MLVSPIGLTRVGLSDRATHRLVNGPQGLRSGPLGARRPRSGNLRRRPATRVGLGVPTPCRDVKPEPQVAGVRSGVRGAVPAVRRRAQGAQETGPIGLTRVGPIALTGVGPIALTGVG